MFAVGQNSISVSKAVSMLPIWFDKGDVRVGPRLDLIGIRLHIAAAFMLHVVS